jgi:hypothetical protein
MPGVSPLSNYPYANASLAEKGNVLMTHSLASSLAEVHSFAGERDAALSNVQTPSNL